MKRRGFLKRLALVAVTAAVSTEITFQAFKTDAEGGLFNKLKGNTQTYEHLTLEKMEELLKEVFLQPRNSSKSINFFIGETGYKNLSKIMKEEHLRKLKCM